ncbi:hypothetical protein ONZ45_g14452 [Pleurotus djamor]|nr:hypothetical protein ONZ45_g14452 [Pleurotus djamor]
MVSSTTTDVVGHLRFGMPVAHAHADPNVAQMIKPAHHLVAEAGTQHEEGARRRPGCRFRQKAVSVSNAFRKALGLPLIENNPNLHRISPVHNGQHDNPYNLPADVLRGATVHAIAMDNNDGAVIPHHRHHGFHQRIKESSYLTRLHYALTILGPWEGRAVAFVLGCGIGVLLRMFWVLAILSYRSMRGPKEEDEYTHIVEFVEAEEIFVAPPNYTLADEKAPITEEDSKAVPTA